MAEAQYDIHNRIAGEIVASIVRPPVDAGGSYTDVLVVLESVVVGVMLVVAKLGGDEVLLDTMVKGAKQRLAELRLGDIGTKGSA